MKVKNAPPITNPYPGLRPFETQYSQFFFGRDHQTEELFQCLSESKFTAVLGYSGSGKSSLVKCGLVPRLHDDLLNTWKVIEFKPGLSPLANMRKELLNPTVGLFESSDEIEGFIASILSRSSHGLVEAIEYANLLPNEQLLLVVDQFEELFRFEKQGYKAGEEALAFVSLLINAVESSKVPIHVLITMRSEFLGHCARFQALPDLINKGQYLIPPMSRSELSEVIVKPVRVYNEIHDTEINLSRGLVETVLNEVGNDQDHLPILQHAMSRTWELWSLDGEKDLIGRNHYERAGRIAQALNKHADAAYNTLKEPWNRLCEKIFKAITERNFDGLETRRPVPLDQLVNLTQNSEEGVRKIVKTFSDAGSFLYTYQVENEESGEIEEVVDISHESLIRKWDRLKKWVAEETDNAAYYLDLAKRAKAHQDSKGEFLKDLDLDQAMQWQEKARPNRVWASRYDDLLVGINFAGVDAFLNFSDEKRIEKRAKDTKRKRIKSRNNKILVLSLASGLLVAIGVGWRMHHLSEIASDATEEAKTNLITAKAKEQEALEAAKLAEENEAIACEAEELANLNSDLLELKSEKLDSANQSLSSSIAANKRLITEIEDKNERLVNDSIKLEKQNQILEDQSSDLLAKTELLQRSNDNELSRRLSLSAIYEIQRDEFENALGYIYQADTIKTKTYTDESYQALEMVWNEAENNNRNFTEHKAKVRAFDQKRNLLVSADENGVVHFSDYRTQSGSPFITSIRKSTMKAGDDFIIDINIAEDLSQVSFTTQRHRLYISKQAENGYGNPLRVKIPFDGKVYDVVATPDHNQYYLLSDTGLFRGKIGVDMEPRLIHRTSNAYESLKVVDGHVFLVSKNRVEVFPPIRQLRYISSSDELLTDVTRLGQFLFVGTYSGNVYGISLKNSGNTVQLQAFSKFDTQLTSPISSIDATKISDSTIQVAVASRHNTCSLIDLNFELNKKQKWTLKGHDGWVYKVKYDDSSKFLISSAADHTIHVWPVSTSQSSQAIRELRTQIERREQ